MIGGYIGDNDSFDRAIATFAEAYADRTDQDYAELLAAVDDGRIQVVHETSRRLTNLART
jgi:hypothetical protein